MSHKKSYLIIFTSFLCSFYANMQCLEPNLLLWRTPCTMKLKIILLAHTCILECLVYLVAVCIVFKSISYMNRKNELCISLFLLPYRHYYVHTDWVTKTLNKQMANIFFRRLVTSYLHICLFCEIPHNWIPLRLKCDILMLLT